MAGHTSRILHFTDTHLHARPDAQLRGANPDESLRRVVDHARGAAAGSDLLLVTGDIADGGSPAAYARFREITAPLGLPVHCLPGNHDDPRAMTAAFRGEGHHCGGTLLLPHWQVVLLDSCAAGDDGGWLAADELARLDDVLARHPQHHALIALHHHPVPTGSRWLDEVGLRNAAALLAVLDRHAHVRLLLWGHVHQTMERHHAGIRLMSTPSTGVQFLPGSDHFALDTRPPAYRRLDLHADGGIESHLVWVE